MNVNCLLSSLVLTALCIASPAYCAGGKGAPPNTAAFRIPLLITAPADSVNTSSPYYVGVPFPKGALKTAGGLVVVDETGAAVPTASRVMARWPEEESIRWMGVDFLGKPNGTYFVIPAPTGPPPAPPPLTLSENDAAFTLETGGARFTLPKKGALISEAAYDQNADGRFDPKELLVANASGEDLYLIDHSGQVALASRDETSGQLICETTLEERAPGEPLLRVVFRREGAYLTDTGEPVARHVTRLTFRAGRPDALIEHRLILIDNTTRLQIADYGLRLRHATPQTGVTLPKNDTAESEHLVTHFDSNTSALSIFQSSAFSFSRVDPERDCRFEITTSKADGSSTPLHQGQRAGNWAHSTDGTGRGLGIALRHLWQTHPKEISATPDSLTVHLWSSRGGQPLDFRYPALKARWPQEWYDTAPLPLKERFARLNTDATGMARTHHLLLSLGSAAPELASAAQQHQRATRCIVDPKWLRSTEAMGRFHPFDPLRFPREEAFMEAWFDQHMDVFRQWGDTGFLEFGNWPHVWYSKATTRPAAGRWQANIDRYASTLDYGFHTHLWRMFARSGNRKYFEAAEETTSHRLDIGMVHWAAPLPATAKQLPRRVKGTYVLSNSPIPWAGNSSFHHNSGTDIRSLAYFYYLADYRIAHEMIQSYAIAVKETWEADIKSPFRGTRPFASLKNLATVYQETGDPALKAILQEQLEWLVDLDAPQGVSEEKETTALGKYGVKVSAIHRVHEVSGDPLAARSLIKGAHTRATTSTGEGPFSYYNSSAEQMAEAARLTGDPIYLRTLKRDMALALSEFSDEASSGWRPLWEGVTPSSASNVYPLGGLAFAMDALVTSPPSQAEAAAALPPFAKQGGHGPAVRVVFTKEEGKPLHLDIRSIKPLSPIIKDHTGAYLSGIIARPSLEQLYSRKEAPTRWMLTLPEALPGGVYQLESGNADIPWEVTWSNASSMVLAVPDGFLLGPGGRQWGNRIMPGSRDHAAPAYFRIPKESGPTIEVYSSHRGELKLEGEPPRPLVPGTWNVIEGITPAQRGTLAAIHCPEVSYIRLRGVSPWVAYGDASRYFTPDLPTPQPEIPHPFPGGNEPFAVTPGPVGTPAGGLFLNKHRSLFIPKTAVRQWLRAKEGAIECWVMPQWSSIGQFRQVPLVRTLFDGGAWRLLLHRFGEMSATALVEGDGAPHPLETNAALLLKEGVWSHLALQWREEGGKFLVELYINGRQQQYGVDNAGMPAEAPAFKATPPGDLHFAPLGKGAPLDALIAGLRFSSKPRYTGDFNPTVASTMRVDAETLACFPLETDTASTAGSGSLQILSQH